MRYLLVAAYLEQYRQNCVRSLCEDKVIKLLIKALEEKRNLEKYDAGGCMNIRIKLDSLNRKVTFSAEELGGVLG